MSGASWVLLGAGSYLALVVAFELLVMGFGRRHAARGVAADESWVTITTSVDGEEQDVVVAGVEHEGRLYVAANHWPRAWFHRVLAHPEVRVTVKGEDSACLAAAVTGDEKARIAQVYRLHGVVRLLAGFPPRAFLRLDPRSAEAPA